MLPEDAKKRKRVEKQPSVIEHFGPEDRTARLIPYSDKALETASLEWLIQTNQVCTFYYFISLMLMCPKTTADPNLWACCVQEHARACISIQPGYSNPLAQAVKVPDHQNVQAPAVLVA